MGHDARGDVAKYGDNRSYYALWWSQTHGGINRVIVKLSEYQGKIILYEGNMVGYGRRSTLEKDGNIFHEHGVFESWKGQLKKDLDLFG